MKKVYIIHRKATGEVIGFDGTFWKEGSDEVWHYGSLEEAEYAIFNHFVGNHILTIETIYIQ